MNEVELNMEKNVSQQKNIFKGNLQNSTPEGGALPLPLLSILARKTEKRGVKT